MLCKLALPCCAVQHTFTSLHVSRQLFLFRQSPQNVVIAPLHSRLDGGEERGGREGYHLLRGGGGLVRCALSFLLSASSLSLSLSLSSFFCSFAAYTRGLVPCQFFGDGLPKVGWVQLSSFLEHRSVRKQP